MELLPRTFCLFQALQMFGEVEDKNVTLGTQREHLELNPEALLWRDKEFAPSWGLSPVLIYHKGSSSLSHRDDPGDREGPFYRTSSFTRDLKHEPIQDLEEDPKTCRPWSASVGVKGHRSRKGLCGTLVSHLPKPS